MILPIGTDRPLRRPTRTTYALIGVCLAVFLGQAVLERVSPALAARWFESLWLDPARPTLWGAITYQFLHGGLLHVAGNMLFLYVFGPSVEDRLGRWWFLVFYLVGGAIAGGAHAGFSGGPPGSGVPASPVVGASGSIAGVTGAYLVLFPLTNVRLLLFFVIVGVYHIPAWCAIAASIAKDLFFHGLGAGDGVARLAHLGGYAYGAAVALALLALKLLPREPFDLFSIGRQAHRRRVFKELTSTGQMPWRHALGKSDKVARTAPTDAQALALADRRAEVSKAISAGDLPTAAVVYLSLVDAHGRVPLARQAQLDIANHLYGVARYPQAAVAYEIFIERYANDREAHGVRLLLASINGRYLNDPVRAKALLAQLEGAPLDAAQRDLAGTLLAELG